MFLRICVLFPLMPSEYRNTTYLVLNYCCRYILYHKYQNTTSCTELLLLAYLVSQIPKYHISCTELLLRTYLVSQNGGRKEAKLTSGCDSISLASAASALSHISATLLFLFSRTFSGHNAYFEALPFLNWYQILLVFACSHDILKKAVFSLYCHHKFLSAKRLWS